MQLAQIQTINKDSSPLVCVDVEAPEPGDGEIRIRVAACGVCHTELDEIEGRTAPPNLPIIPGHEVVGRVDKRGSGAIRYREGDRVGVGWIHHSCGGAEENLSDDFVATGRDVNGGYAEYMTVPEAYAYPIPDVYEDETAAPLLCAGGVGFRALRLCQLQNGHRLGLTGFGGSAHIVAQLVRYLYPDTKVYVFARSESSREHARELGVHWAGNTRDKAPELLNAIIDTTPAWTPIVEALANLAPGGRLVVNAIRKEDSDKDALINVDYDQHLWREKTLQTVANVTSADLREFLPLAENAGIRPDVECYDLEDANRALVDLKFGPVRGAKVLRIA